MKHMVVVYEIEDDTDISDMLPKFPRAQYIGMTPGIKVRQLGTGQEAFIPYARYFDEKSSRWQGPEFAEYNWVLLRQQQNWANDILKSRGHLFLNEVLDMLGMPRTPLGAVVGWVYEKDSFVDFRCWSQQETPIREDAILLDFNVTGPVLHAIS